MFHNKIVIGRGTRFFPIGRVLSLLGGGSLQNSKCTTPRCFPSCLGFAPPPTPSDLCPPQREISPDGDILSSLMMKCLCLKKVSSNLEPLHDPPTQTSLLPTRIVKWGRTAGQHMAGTSCERNESEVCLFHKTMGTMSCDLMQLSLISLHREPQQVTLWHWGGELRPWD